MVSADTYMTYQKRGFRGMVVSRLQCHTVSRQPLATCLLRTVDTIRINEEIEIYQKVGYKVNTNVEMK